MGTHGAQAAVSMAASPPHGDGYPGAGGAAPPGPRPSPAGLRQDGTPEPAGPAAPLPNDGFAAEIGTGSSGPTPRDTGTGGEGPGRPRGKGLVWALIEALVGISSAAGGSQPRRDSAPPVPAPPCPSLVPVVPSVPCALSLAVPTPGGRGRAGRTRAPWSGLLTALTRTPRAPGPHRTSTSRSAPGPPAAGRCFMAPAAAIRVPRPVSPRPPGGGRILPVPGGLSAAIGPDVSR